jgi:hypothetical protein
MAIRFKGFKERPRTPVIYVTNIGGLYRVDENTIKETLITELPNSHGGTDSVSAVHLIWPAWRWLDSEEIYRFSRRQFQQCGLGLPLIN